MRWGTSWREPSLLLSRKSMADMALGHGVKKQSVGSSDPICHVIERHLELLFL